MRKSGFKKDLPALPPREFFMFILLICNHTVRPDLTQSISILSCDYLVLKSLKILFEPK